MGIYVKDPVTDKAVRKLAKLRKTTLTDAIRTAVQKELAADKADKSNVDDAAVDAIIEKFAALPKTGLVAEKAFYDSLNDE